MLLTRLASCTVHWLFTMASKPKPHLLHKGGAAALQSSAKRARTMSSTSESSSSSFKDAFGNYANYLNNLNDKRERVVKASRDITMNSKKVIFQVHRISKDNRDEVLDKAEKDLASVTEQYMFKLVKELQGTDFWKLRRAYSPGVQEYVEAATFCKFCRTGTLLNLDEINATLLPLSEPSVEPLQINVLDYLLGLADLTGELMRLAIGRISDGELEYAKKICEFVRDIYRELTLIVPYMDDSSDMKTKMDTMLQSVVKIENACFGVHVRGSEYTPLVGSSEPSSFLLRVSDVEI
ncbi:PREDICTED: translin-associated protein X isoform X2 [Populus euphratica]|uniref:Translin-associated protein X isoform X2 n=1 Tax=Populus euphratica TaxID=75702 RepID=A0AAJ6X8R8_POPEU|nr:PREDICTED: translin-associated protein X isoform X2 [Populus euphratica]